MIFLKLSFSGNYSLDHFVSAGLKSLPTPHMSEITRVCVKRMTRLIIVIKKGRLLSLRFFKDTRNAVKRQLRTRAKSYLFIIC